VGGLDETATVIEASPLGELSEDAFID